MDNIQSLSKQDLTNFLNSNLLNGGLDFLHAPRPVSRLLTFIEINYDVYEISLRNSGLEELPPEIGNLLNLEVLLLNNFDAIDESGEGQKNKLQNLPREIERLRNLKLLNVNNNLLSSLPSEIQNLTNLRKLYLRSNNFRIFPRNITKLENLQGLDLCDNNITDLPPEITNISKIKWLNLSNNNLLNIPSEIGTLKNLRYLNLSSNNINSLPKEMLDLKGLSFLDLTGNKLPIPDEILSKPNDPEAILNYYFSVVDDTSNVQSINETKLIIVGQGSVGKTSLADRLLYDEFNPHQLKTEGIEITKWEVAINNNAFRINIWDFGGQEIMHATHQFFLTKRCVYLLVLDSRQTQEENRVDYWLAIIQSFGGDSPVIIIGNKTDQHPLDIDRTGFRDKYKNIIDILEVSAATGAGIDTLKIAITNCIHNLPHIMDLLPEKWIKVKSSLEDLGKSTNFITPEEYRKICNENNLIDEVSQRTLIGFLHDLGVILYFQDNPRLETLGILNPQWVTNGVYKILNSHSLFQSEGVLTLPVLYHILNSVEYPREKRLYIVDMMKKFELCYDLGTDQTFLVPDLLPKDKPVGLNFTGNPAFEYSYPVLPSSIITRFIVRMNQKIEGGFVWRTGVLLKIGENKALVEADIEDRTITIAVDGLEHTRRETLTGILYHLNDIHDSIKGLNPEKLVPVPGVENAKPIPYNYLLMLEAKGIEVLPIPDGNRLIDVNVRKVLGGVPNETYKKGMENMGNVTNIIVGGNFDGNLTVGDRNQSFKDSYNKITTSEIDIELKQSLKELVQAVETMTKFLNEDQSAEVTEDLGKLVNEAIQPKPNPKWYSVSIEGLIKAAENLDKLGEPVINLSQKVLSLLTGIAFK